MISVKSLETKRYPLLAKLPLPTHCSAEVEIQQGELSEQSKSPLLPHRTVFKCMCLQRRGRVSAREGGSTTTRKKKQRQKNPKTIRCTTLLEPDLISIIFAESTIRHRVLFTPLMQKKLMKKCADFTCRDTSLHHFFSCLFQ